MNFELSKEQELIQKAVKEYAEKAIIPIYQQIDQNNKVPPEIFRGLADLDLFGLQYLEKYGGTGGGYSCYSLVLEQISRASSGVAMTIHSLGTSAIFLFGTPEQKTRYMPSACNGQTISSFAFTEPSTGSDPKQITTTAVRNGDHYIVNVQNALYPMLI